ncbi:hypothetical protein B9Y02_06320 [Acinetobacter baumannii]|nr:hypothetical protein [Acinetobacter baumannii]EKP44164.1 PLD-like domain protein [Acinetobacter baumannii OIFC111]EXB39962.1 PLD-like domain protein [Acinetobacter baumannii 1461963]EXH39460.1 PLD-like domain protein [Acinetobacter baumannii 1293320]EHU1920878.1 hypothetical protein [Acinetobacter baumannii]
MSNNFLQLFYALSIINLKFYWMKEMNLSALSISELTDKITADGTINYLTGKKLTQLFNSFGSRDDYDTLIKEEKFGSRATYTKNKLQEINGTIHLKNLLEYLVDERSTDNSESIAEALNKILKYDGFCLEKGLDNIYRITGTDFPEELKVNPVFEDIEKEIIQHIRSAQFLVWVAVAWITSRPIAEALYNQHKKGVNIRIIVNDDQLTKTNGIKFENTTIEYYKISPLNASYKNTMHHKFCIIDLKKVITGSFNWTNKANFNNENISVIEQREQGEAYAQEFLKLIKDIERK